MKEQLQLREDVKQRKTKEQDSDHTKLNDQNKYNNQTLARANEKSFYPMNIQQLRREHYDFLEQFNEVHLK